MIAKVRVNVCSESEATYLGIPVVIGSFGEVG